MVAPGPGDGSVDDEMDEEEVEAAQKMNDAIMEFHNMAKKGILPDTESLSATPYTS
jgi:hypothetical protein